jgi:hypothetical protein
VVWAFAPDSQRFLRREDLGAEPLGLRYRPPGKIASAEPRWETEIILDTRAEPRLPAGASRSTITVFRPSEAP